MVFSHKWISKIQRHEIVGDVSRFSDIYEYSSVEKRNISHEYLKWNFNGENIHFWKWFEMRNIIFLNMGNIYAWEYVSI